MEITNSIGNFLRNAREDKGFGLRELSEKAEISPAQLSKIERNITHPSRDACKKLAYALNLPQEDVLLLAGYVEPMQYVFNWNDNSEEATLSQVPLSSIHVNESTVAYEATPHAISPYDPPKELTEAERDFYEKEITAARDMILWRIADMRKGNGGGQGYFATERNRRAHGAGGVRLDSSDVE